MDNKLFRNYYVDFHEKRNKYGKSSNEKMFGYLREIIGTGKKVLDLGCRDGNLTKNYIEGNDVTGADVDDVALSICKKNLGINTYHLDLNEPLPFDDSSFDVVVAGEVIEHLIFPEHFVKEVSRVLKSKGLFCGSTPNITRMKNRLQFLSGKTPFFDDTAHLRYFSYNNIRKLLSDYFSKVIITPFGGHIIGNTEIGLLKLGIAVTPDTPLWIGKIFSSNLFWKVKK